MSKKHIDDVFVLYKDNTYKTIRPEDDIILKTARKKNVKYLLFPINSKSGVKYYKEEPSNILSKFTIQVKGIFTILNFTADGVYTTDEVSIDMKSRNIIEAYSVLGSLYDTQLCFDSLNLSAVGDFSLCAGMMDFDIKIHSDGQDYHLTSEIFDDIVDRSDEGDLLSEFEIPVILFEELIHYIEHTVFFKEKYSGLSHQNKDYIIYPDGTYEILSYDTSKRKKVNKPIEVINNAAVLVSTSTSEYAVVSLQEFNIIQTESVYTIMYTVYNKEIITALNDIQEDEINSTILNELDGHDFEVLWEDTLFVHSLSEFIFVMVSLNELVELLIKAFVAYGTEFSYVCFTVSANYRYDNYHSFSVNEHATSKMIRNGYDLLYNMVRYIKSAKHKYELGEIL